MVKAQPADLDALRADKERDDRVRNQQAEAAERAIPAVEQRRRQLATRRPGIDRALQQYDDLDRGEAPEIRIRVPFIQLATPRDDRIRNAKRIPPGRPQTRAPWDRSNDISTRPPMTKLLASSGSRALPTYLSALYIAHLRAVPGEPFENDIPNTQRWGSHSWVELAGMYLPNSGALTPGSRKRRQRKALTTALDTLEQHRLIALSGPAGRAGRYEHFRVLTESGAEDQYRVPGGTAPNKEAIRVPWTFFSRGWHLVLTPAETATLLAIIDRTALYRNLRRERGIMDMGVDLKESVRWKTYGLSDEAYETVHNLHDFGLIRVLDPMPNRANPKPYTHISMVGRKIVLHSETDERVALRLIYPPEPSTPRETLFDKDAFDVVDTALSKRTTALQAVADAAETPPDSQPQTTTSEGHSPA